MDQAALRTKKAGLNGDMKTLLESIQYDKAKYANNQRNCRSEGPLVQILCDRRLSLVDFASGMIRPAITCLSVWFGIESVEIIFCNICELNPGPLC